MGKYKVLSIDGGGIKGIIPAVIIRELEKELNKLSQNPHGHITDYFDMIAGTSTGGILACIYLSVGAKENTYKYTTTDAINFYTEYGSKIFSQPNLIKRFVNINGIFSPKYDSRALEKILSDHFGDLRLSQLAKPCLITAYNIRSRYAHFFTQHDAKKNQEYDYYVKDIARATSAAPTYFKPAMVIALNGIAHYPLVDGGLYGNNPALCAYSEIYEEFQREPEDMIIVSIGTGRSYSPIKYKNAKTWGVSEWISPLFDILINAGPDVVHYQLKTIFKAIGKSEQYCRINPKISRDDTGMNLIDNVSSKNIDNLIEFSRKECIQMKNRIEKTAKIIFDNL